ncbi:hypothetical protein MMC17_008731 [Xylographa soralifera]|nr:hypothetical protein [Xylographa soralifera]
MSAQAPAAVNLDDTLGPQIARITVAMAVLAGIALVGRLICRRMLKLQLAVSDYLIVTGLLGVWMYSGLIIGATTLGLGEHIRMVSTRNLITQLQLIYAGEIIYFISLPIIKLSILFLYHSLFPGKVMTIAINVVGLTIIMWGTSGVLVAIFSCNPISGFWDVTMSPAPICIDDTKFFLGTSIPNILTDVATLCLPIGRVWKLQMSRQTKIAISSIFLLGGFVTIASILRLVFLLDINKSDITYSYYGITVWSAVETNLAVISACLPTMRPLLHGLMPSSIHSKIASRRRGNMNSSGKIQGHSSRGASNPKREAFQRLPEYALSAFGGTEETSVHISASNTAEPRSNHEGINVQNHIETIITKV